MTSCDSGAAEESPSTPPRFEIPRFLEGFSVRRAPQFDEWVSAARGGPAPSLPPGARPGRRARRWRQWRWREAVDLADRWLALRADLRRSGPARRRGALSLGQPRRGALARFAEYRELLAVRRGASRAARSRRWSSGSRPIGRRRRAADHRRVVRPRSDLRVEPRGRGTRSGRRSAAWKGVQRGRGSIVLVDGESGVGKSRLTDEFLRWVVADGGTDAAGTELRRRAGIPYEPVVEALREALGAPGLAGTSPEWLAEVARLLPELRERFPGLPVPAEAESTRRLAPVRGHRAAPDRDRRGAAGRDRDRRPALVRRGQLQPAPLSHPPAGARRRAVARHAHPGEVERDAPAARLCRVVRAKSHADVVTVGAATRGGCLAAGTGDGPRERAQRRPALRGAAPPDHRR